MTDTKDNDAVALNGGSGDDRLVVSPVSAAWSILSPEDLGHLRAATPDTHFVFAVVATAPLPVTGLEGVFKMPVMNGSPVQEVAATTLGFNALVNRADQAGICVTSCEIARDGGGRIRIANQKPLQMR